MGRQYIALYGTAQLGTAETRHHHITDDDIRQMSGPDLVESLLSVIGSEQLEFSFKDAGEEPQHVRVVLDQEHGAESLISVLGLYLVTSCRYHSFLVISIL